VVESKTRKNMEELVSVVETERAQLLMNHDTLSKLACDRFGFAAIDKKASAALDTYLDDTVEETLATAMLEAATNKRRTVTQEDMPAARKRQRAYLWKV
jgi:histone H3/H4